MPATVINLTDQTQQVVYGLPTPQTVPAFGVLVVPDGPTLPAGAQGTAYTVIYTAGAAAVGWGTIPNGSTSPPAYAAGTAYARGCVVIGSDERWYQATMATSGADPTTANLAVDGAPWVLVPAGGRNLGAESWPEIGPIEAGPSGWNEVDHGFSIDGLY